MSRGDFTFVGYENTGGSKGDIGNCIWVDPIRKLVFTFETADKKIYSYSYDTVGNLTYKNVSAAWAWSPNCICGDANHSILIVGRLVDSRTASYKYDSDGLLTQVTNITNKRSLWSYIDTTIHCFFGATNNVLQTFYYDNDGNLVFVHSDTTFNLYHRGIWADSDLQLLFVCCRNADANYGFNDGLKVFNYNHSYELSDVDRDNHGNSVYDGGCFGDKEFKLVFCGISSNTVYIYSYTLAGMLTYIGTISLSSAGSSTPRLWVDPVAKTLFVSLGTDMYTYTYDENGNVTLVDSSTRNGTDVYGETTNNLFFRPANTYGVESYDYEGLPGAPSPTGLPGKYTPILINKRRYVYKIGNDELQTKLMIFKGKELQYRPNLNVELWLNYEGAWYKHEDYTTNRYGIAHMKHIIDFMPDIDCCLGLAQVYIDGKTYNSNIVRFNFVEGIPRAYEIDAGSCSEIITDRSSYDIFDGRGRAHNFDRMFGG